MVDLVKDVDRGSIREFTVVIECPKGSRVKYEVDKKTGVISFDRVLYSSMHYPCNYGFIPRTHWADGDPLDVLVVTHEALVPGCLVKCRAIGYLEMIDGGDSDIKVIAVPIKDPRFSHVKHLKDLGPHISKEISHFFKVYKDLEKKEVKVKGMKGVKDTHFAIKKAFDEYDQGK